jgi:hypothetical protein
MTDFYLRKELKEKFLRDLNPAERILFLKKAKEAIISKGYQVSENLFHYCYYLALKERFKSINPERNQGMLRFLLVEGKKDIEDALALYESKLEETKLPVPDQSGLKFLEYFSE